MDFLLTIPTDANRRPTSMLLPLETLGTVGECSHKMIFSPTEVLLLQPFPL